MGIITNKNLNNSKCPTAIATVNLAQARGLVTMMTKRVVVVPAQDLVAAAVQTKKVAVVAAATMKKVAAVPTTNLVQDLDQAAIRTPMLPAKRRKKVKKKRKKRLHLHLNTNHPHFNR